MGVVADGVIGPNTLKAIKEADPVSLIDKFTHAKEVFYQSLPTFATFVNGKLVNETQTNKAEVLAELVNEIK